jgi:DNA-binding response OmpR family regulator
MIRVLLVEDEDRLATQLSAGLRTVQMDVTWVKTGREGLTLAKSGGFDLLVLDIGLPDQEGFTVLRRLRSAGSRLPVIILTARTSAEDTVRGLEHGADDYMPKPFSFDELVLRIRLRMRRDDPHDAASGVVVAGRCVLDPVQRTVESDGEPVKLSNREFQLLDLLMRNAGDVVTRQAALDHVWGGAAGANVLDVYIGYLRSRLGSEAIETVRGRGFRFVS